MKVKIDELEGMALDWAIAKAIGKYVASYSTDWSQGGPLIESESITVGLCINPNEPKWLAYAYRGPKSYNGRSDKPLIAVCRAIIASKLGDEIEIPEELA